MRLLNVLWTIHAVGNNDCKLAGNTGKEYIRFCGGVIPGFSSGNTHVYFQVVDGTFHNGPNLVKRIPFTGIPLNTGKHAEIEIFIGVGGMSLFGSAAGITAFADSLPFFVVHSGTSPFDTVRPLLFFCNTKMFHCKGAVTWVGGIAVFVVADFFEGTFISWIVRDKCPGEMKIIP